MRDQGPKRLGDVLSDWLPKAAAASQESHAELTRFLRQTVGEPLGSGLRVVSLKRGVLLVEADSAARLHEVAAFRREGILEAFRSDMPTAGVVDLRVRPGRRPR